MISTVQATHEKCQVEWSLATLILPVPVHPGTADSSSKHQLWHCLAAAAEIRGLAGDFSCARSSGKRHAGIVRSLNSMEETLISPNMDPVQEENQEDLEEQQSDSVERRISSRHSRQLRGTR